MVKIVVEESGGINPHIPEKVYKVRLAGIRERIINVEKKDKKNNVVLGADNQPVMEDVDRWEWVFGLRPEEGKVESDIKFTHLTSPKISTKSNAFSFVKALLGGVAPEKGKEFDTDILIGKYADAVVKDKDPKKDRTGNIVLTSGIKELSASGPTTPGINIEGLFDEEEGEPEPEPAPDPAPGPAKKGKK
jgi:hypothetical protein